jgi:hypothetical protein
MLIFTIHVLVLWPVFLVSNKVSSHSTATAKGRPWVAHLTCALLWTSLLAVALVLDSPSIGLRITRASAFALNGLLSMSWFPFLQGMV